MVKQIIKMYDAPEKPKVIIFVDKREAASGMRDALGNYDCEVKDKFLVIGDYVLSDRVVVERKTASDFISSIVDRRLFSQLASLKDSFDKPILIIEGNGLFNNDRVPKNVVRGALASIALDFNVPILCTSDVDETSGLLFWIAQREQIGEKREVSIRGSKKATSLKDQQEYLVSGLPGISNVRARELLKYFGSPLAIFNADEKELASVKKLGEKTSQQLKEVITKKYKAKK